MEENFRLHIRGEQRLENIVDFVENPGMIYDVNPVRHHREASLIIKSTYYV